MPVKYTILLALSFNLNNPPYVQTKVLIFSVFCRPANGFLLTRCQQYVPNLQPSVAQSANLQFAADFPLDNLQECGKLVLVQNCASDPSEAFLFLRPLQP